MSADELFVFFGEDVAPCGVVRRVDDGRVRFRYVEQATRRISHSLPLTIGTNEVDGVFFEGLLPEGVERERLARRLGVSDASTFALLAAVGGDCAGALSLHESSTRPAATLAPPSLRALDESLFAQIEEHGTAPTIVTHGLRLSLAGAQGKLAVVVQEDGRLALPVGTTPSTHILKFPNRDFAGLVDNEHFVMTLARLAGLPAPATRLVPLPSGRRALLVERFDRSAGRRIHQEDFCQALALPPPRKYEADGGPGLAACVDVPDGGERRAARRPRPRALAELLRGRRQ